MWNPSPTTYLTAIISETWGKTDDPLTISWQRPSSWFKTVAICPSSMKDYWETLSCSALIVTSCERNVSPKETTSHSRNPEKLLAPWQSYQATAPRNYKRSRYNTSQLTTQSQRQHQRPERQQSPLVWNYLVEAHGEKKTLRSDWSRHLFLGLSYCEAMITFNENFSKHWRYKNNSESKMICTECSWRS